MMDLTDVVTMIGIVGGVVAIAASLETLLASARDRRLVQFANEVVVGERVSARDIAYWSGTRTAALKRLESRLAQPARRFALAVFMLGVCVGFMALQGPGLRGLVEDFSWRTVLSAAVNEANGGLLLGVALTFQLSAMLLNHLVALTNGRGAIVGRSTLSPKQWKVQCIALAVPLLGSAGALFWEATQVKDRDARSHLAGVGRLVFVLAAGLILNTARGRTTNWYSSHRADSAAVAVSRSSRGPGRRYRARPRS